MQLTKKSIKLFFAHYFLEDIVFENVDHIKYPGVAVSNKFRWNSHFSGIKSLNSTKPFRILCFLKRNIYLCAQCVKEAAHKSGVSGIGMQYIFLGSSRSSPLERAWTTQLWAAKFIKCKYNYETESLKVFEKYNQNTNGWTYPYH